ncbi:MAG: hypothetical protein ABIR63_07530 [Sphingomicrobium sp.]
MTHSKPFTLVAALIFLAMALVHVYRLVTPFQVVFGSQTVPQSVSWIGVIVPAILSFMLFKESKS